MRAQGERREWVSREREEREEELVSERESEVEGTKGGGREARRNPAVESRRGGKTCIV